MLAAMIGSQEKIIVQAVRYSTVQCSTSIPCNVWYFPGSIEDGNHREKDCDAETHPGRHLVDGDEQGEERAEHEQDAREEGLHEVVGPDPLEGEH